MAELRNRTAYETYKDMVDRAFQLGEFGAPKGGQTPFHRLAAFGVSMLPTHEWVTGPLSFLKDTMIREEPAFAQAHRAIREGEFTPPSFDLHAALQNPALQNTAAGLAFGGWLAADDLMRGTAQRLSPSPRHSTLGEIRAARGARGHPGGHPRETGPLGESGGVATMEKPTVRSTFRDMLEKMTDSQLRDAIDRAYEALRLANATDPDYLVKTHSYEILVREMRRRSAPEFAPPGMTPNYIGPERQLPPHTNPLGDVGFGENLPADVAKKLDDRVAGLNSRQWPVHPELAKARERVRARQRAHEKKAAELQSPKEEGEKLGPLPPFETMSDADWYSRLVREYGEQAGDLLGRTEHEWRNMQRYEKAYHELHEGPGGPLDLSGNTQYPPLYHGSPTKFDPNDIKLSKGGDWGPGYYLTKHREDAEGYSRLIPSIRTDMILGGAEVPPGTLAEYRINPSNMTTQVSANQLRRAAADFGKDIQELVEDALQGEAMLDPEGIGMLMSEFQYYPNGKSIAVRFARKAGIKAVELGRETIVYDRSVLETPKRPITLTPTEASSRAQDLSDIRAMSDMSLMARAAPNREADWFIRAVKDELRRRGIIPPGTRF